MFENSQLPLTIAKLVGYGCENQTDKVNMWYLLDHYDFIGGALLRVLWLLNDIFKLSFDHAYVTPNNKTICLQSIFSMTKACYYLLANDISNGLKKQISPLFKG